MKLLTDLFDPALSAGPLRSLKRPLYSWALSGGPVPEQLLVLPPDPWAGDSGRGRWVINRVADHHGMHVSLEPQVWGDSKLARHPIQGPVIHSFDYLRDLRALGGDQARRLGRTLMQEWMEENRNWREGVWDFPVTARRVASWLMGYEFFCASADDAFLDSLYASLMRQVRHLDRADPNHMYGIDALYVIRALTFAGLAFEGSEDLLEDTLAWLDHWIQHEIDGQGMHVSRSPATCVAAARALIDIRGALVRGGYASPTTLQAAIDRLMHSIRFFKMPDAKLSCFHGGSED
ncbi:MAG TPA: heparinase, partial [Alphaproteobacteria bacterium]